MWDLDNREESGLQRCGGSKESQSEQFGRSSIRILEGLKEDGWLEYKQTGPEQVGNRGGWHRPDHKGLVFQVIIPCLILILRVEDSWQILSRKVL